MRVFVVHQINIRDIILSVIHCTAQLFCDGRFRPTLTSTNQRNTKSLSYRTTVVSRLVIDLRLQQRRTRSTQRRSGRVPFVRHRRQEHRSTQNPVLLSDHVEIPRFKHRTNRKFPSTLDRCLPPRIALDLVILF